MSERWKLVLLGGGFALAFFLPIESPRVQGALLEGFWLHKNYARQHVLLCLVPAFYIAGAISQFASQGAVLRYLGAKAPHVYVLNGNGASPDTMTVSTRQDTLANTHAAVEWYHEAFDHYFHTASALENQVLNDGAYANDWNRTFGFFRVWTAPGAGRQSVSRFFSTQWGTKSSHFYTAVKSERDLLVAGIITGWQLEADDIYYIGLADMTTGACPAGTVPLYRMYNNMLGGAPTHRFTGSAATRDQMVAQGWVAEGSGPDVVYGCTPPL